MKKKQNRVIILGADGMLGNAMYGFLSQNGIKTFGTSNKKNSKYYFFDVKNFNFKIFNKMLTKFKPNFIINCIGYIRPQNEGLEELQISLMVNSLFPQKLSIACLKSGVRLVHFSTDCVFSGSSGPYGERDIPDESKNYGLSKFLGEVRELPNITIRTSIIGREIGATQNLLDWFLNTQEKRVKGYKNVFWNGISTLTASKIVKKIIEENINFDKPVIQIVSETTNKYKLLKMFKEIYNKKTEVIPLNSDKVNKTLFPSNMQKRYFSDLIPSIREQVIELKNFYGKY